MASDQSQFAMKVTEERLSRLGITVDINHVGDNFNENLVQGHNYLKKTNVPFSLFELEGLREAMEERVTTVNAIQFTNDIDLLLDPPIHFNQIVPLIDCLWNKRK
ncbi:hypothetical protein [Paenibacillus agricola]|uniref:Uncharacterized protein n=1 Tax=Paenibacillus agricola TaxID=2716264 RepID=A0ABX0JCZ1_9BACL|nr:hypothetical protein [Paenibacillus agricola]NHN34340.1 hypothetical protein [Paenibacillus agricola]